MVSVKKNQNKETKTILKKDTEYNDYFWSRLFSNFIARIQHFSFPTSENKFLYTDYGDRLLTLSNMKKKIDHTNTEELFYLSYIIIFIFSLM